MFAKTKMLIALGAALFGGAFLAQQDDGRATKIGYVNLQKVRLQHKGQLALVEKLEGKVDAIGKAFAGRKEAVTKKAREELPLFEKGSKERQKLYLEIKKEEHAIKLEQQVAVAEFQERQITLEEAFYNEIVAKVAEFAKARGYDAIHLTRPVPRVQRETDIINLRNHWVVYHDPALDITNELIKTLNK